MGVPIPLVTPANYTYVCICVPTRFLNHATQRDQTLHKIVNKYGEDNYVNNWKFLERD